MRSDCHSMQLGDLIDVKHGWPFKSELFSEELSGKGIVVAIGNFRYSGGFRFSETACKEYRGSYPLEYELSQGDILLVMTCQTAGGEILGIPAKVPNDGRLYLHNQRIGRVVLKSNVVRLDFLYWLFLTPDFNRSLVSTASGTKILHTSPSRICDYRFCLPSLEVQSEVAKTLDALQDKITLLRETNATLEAIVQALFKSWFVDCDPVRAKAEGRDPIGMPPEVADLLPSEFEDSELGEIPKGWQVGRLGDVLKQRVERTKPSSQTEQLPYVPIECISSKSVFLVESRPGFEAQSSLTLFKKGDIVFGAMRPYFHKVCLAPFDGVTRTTAFVLAPIKPEMAMFALFQMFDDRTIEFATNHSEGSTIPYAKWAGSMENMSIVVPPDDVAAAFGEIVDGLMRRGIQNTEQSQSLAELRDTLLPRLMSGKLRIPDIQDAIEEALA